MTIPRTYTVLAIGDVHDNPKDNKRRFKWMARHATAIKAQAIIQIGDFLDLDSLCRHVKNDTYAAKSKPTFDDDMNSFTEAMNVFDKHLGYKPETKHITLGNHEYRAWTFENENPETFNTMANRLTNILESHKWTWTPYGEYYNYKGVDFVHRPLNHMRKPVGGKHAARAVAVDSARDVVFGDTHRFYDCRISRLGTNGKQRVRAVEIGCAMEWGIIKEYAKHNATGWWWGVTELIIREGRIEGVNSIPMFELQRKYD